MQSPPSFVFVIDTDKYSGNFEREMCGFITGQIGECGVGDEQAEKFKEKYGALFLNIIGEEADDHGCYRPVGISTAPDSDECASVEIYFDEKPSDDLIQLMKTRAHEFAKNERNRITDEKFDIKILGFRLIENKVQTTESSV